MYYIYHIDGIKIGCSTEPKRRVMSQGYSDYEILETHTDIYEASKREMELQLQYGYTIDKSTYFSTIKSQSKAADKIRKDKKPKVKIYENGVTHPGFKARKILLQYDTNNQFIKEWKSLTDASNTLNINPSSISSAALGNFNTAGGYVWKYKK
jgi:hypothetical protein